MSQLTRHPAYLAIEDQLDTVGQKYRAVQITRGMLLWATAAIVSCFVAAMLAHLLGPGKLAISVFILWCAWLAGSAIVWVITPLLFKPRNVEIARLVEGRVDGLHNGLTNSVLLARADDIADSPWMGQIFDEIAGTVRCTPLGQAFSLRDLRGLSLRILILLAPLLLLCAFPSMRARLGQGWRQMFSPTVFVPKVGSIRILEVVPTQITLVTGQPLEITVLAEDPAKGLPIATLLFEDAKLAKASLTPTATENEQLRYAYRLEHVDRPTRFRVEIEGTQSEWCEVNVVRQVKLQELVLVIDPPKYTDKPQQTLSLKADQIEKTPVAVLEGSSVRVSAVVDVPVKSALLSVNDLPPVAMSVGQEGKQFTHSLIVMQDVTACALLKEGQQIIARLPDPGLRITCTKDSAPSIHMKWPAADAAVPPKAELKLLATLKDDHAVKSARVLMAAGPDAPLLVVHEVPFPAPTNAAELSCVLEVPSAHRVHGQSIRVQVEATDNRSMAGLLGTGLGAPESAKDLNPQTTASPVYEIKFRDPEMIATEQKEQFDKIRALIQEMIRKQQELLTMAVAWKPSLKTMPTIHHGQVELRKMMLLTADTFPFEPDDKIIQKTLLVLAHNPAKDAIGLAMGIDTEPVEAEKLKQNKDLQAKQRRIIDTLETLISRLAAPTSPATQPSKAGGDLDNEKEKLKELNEALKKFIAEEKRILDATASLAKKPVDDFDKDDQKLLEELKIAQEKLDAFMQEKISDFSKLAEQDMANASLLKEMLEVYSEVTMAKDALKKQAVEMAIPLEEMGVELAKEIQSNLEKWLWNEADRQKWNQEDPVGKTDIPMAELPKELEDMVGELLEEQEDLFEEMEDTAANWADSLDKGAGWDAMDGPIANMSAKGVTGNQLPNNNEMNGRSGEGRSGKSSGEMVEETASGKGGRNTPTRLDPTPFQQGQIKDESKDPTGGATGGGKISGQGGAGLEGPVPPKDLRDKMQRLANKQAELRNKAEKLDLDKKLAAYDNFKLMGAAAMMRRVESDIHANRYNNALRRKDILLDKLETSHLLLSGQIHTQRDSTPKMSDKLEDQINDVQNGQLPAAWSEALKEYYRKLSQE